MEDIANLSLTNQSPHSEAGRATMGIMGLEFGITRRNCFRLRHLHIFGSLKIYTLQWLFYTTKGFIS